ncbi:MAG TPA: 23S rRNA (uracil(1939)-C(5))-methyltransferase RlmD [Clostridia bacterium]|nr:23S rRNA (uracil(1939)-C(5))-methyltransferase RlmD [Clostridia bacterium]
MKQDDIITLEVTDYGMKGEGIGEIEGFTVFVPFAISGETIKAKVTHVKRNLVFAKLLEIIIPSKNRINVGCNRFMRCGGCDLMHIEYATQLEIKRQNLINLLKKNAKIDFIVEPTVPSPKQLGYRNKIQLPFGTINGKVAVGFYKENTHKIVSITKCFLHESWVEKVIAVVLEFANGNNLTAYDDFTKKGLLRHLVVRHSDNKMSIVMVINSQNLPYADKLVELLDAQFSDTYSLFISPKLEHNNVVMGNTVYPVIERDFTVNVLGIDFTVNPYSFLQLNNEVRDLIYNRIIEKITTTSDNIVIDAYAGVGLIGAVLAKRGATVYNIEIIPEAIKDANKLAKANNVSSSITNILGDAAEHLPKLINYITGTQYNKDSNLNIIIDPPRKGCSAEVIRALNGLNVPHKLFYISCNPATLTRDLAELKNYTIQSITPYDMFPQTKHLETLVCLTRKP